MKDAEWIADLLRHGLLRGSFIPTKPQRELRELVRHRANVVSRRAQVVNERQRTLESTNIKLGNVVSDITGVRALSMLEGMLAGQADPAVLAEMARGRLKEKKGMLQGEQELLDRLDQIPGINQRVAQVIAAEVGTEKLERLFDEFAGAGKQRGLTKV